MYPKMTVAFSFRVLDFEINYPNLKAIFWGFVSSGR